MKLTIAMMTSGLVLLSGIANVRAEIFTSDGVHYEESKQNSAADRSPIEPLDVDVASALTDVNTLGECGFNRIGANPNQQKKSSERVDLVIKRSRQGIQVTFAPQPDRVSEGGQRHRVKSGSGEFDVPSRICSLTEDSFERTSVKKKVASVSGRFGHSKRDGLFGGNFNLMPGLTSLALATVDLIGVVIGCYRQRRSFVV